MNMQHLFASGVSHTSPIIKKFMTICRGIKHSPQADRMPNPKKGENVYQFKNWKRRMQVPYYFVTDFEAILKPIVNENHINKTKKIQEHIPCSFAYMKIQEEEIHNNAEHCWVCEKEFGRPEEKVRDHCHITDCADPNHLWRIDKNRCFAYPEKFKITKNHVPTEILEIFIKKGVYPYEYMDSWSKFDKDNLPPKNAFYSKLNNTHILDSEYEYVQYVWKKARCSTMRDYHNIYSRIFSKVLWSTPGLAWDALFLKTRQKLELITDQDMYMMVEEGLRGGISMVSR
ncbi:hypothetical protein RhiirB3_447377 [Rhizophagus irregularis]|nr:hypothetical protein RhiirB3_447377 [Rhizophagus irregularis]